MKREEIKLNNPITIDQMNDLLNKQDKLLSGYNIKTINGYSLIGEGDLDIIPVSSIVFMQYIGGLAMSQNKDVVRVAYFASPDYSMEKYPISEYRITFGTINNSTAVSNWKQDEDGIFIQIRSDIDNNTMDNLYNQVSILLVPRYTNLWKIQDKLKSFSKQVNI